MGHYGQCTHNALLALGVRVLHVPRHQLAQQPRVTQLALDATLVRVRVVTL